MKLAFALSLLFISHSAFAVVPCNEFLKCGVYQNVVNDKDDKGIMNAVFAPEGEGHARMLLESQEGPNHGWINVRFDFKDDGTFLGYRQNEQLYMTGSCKKDECQFSMDPKAGQIPAGMKVTGLITFKETEVVYVQTVETSDGKDDQTIVLKKIN